MRPIEAMTLVGLAAALNLSACDQDPAAAIHVAQAPAAEPQAPTRPMSVPDGTTSETGPRASACRSRQLRLSAEGGDAGAGNRVAVLAAQNVGAQPCSLDGYPTVTLLDGQGRSLTEIRAEQQPGNYFGGATEPTPVTLAPQAKAYFDIAWSVVPNEAIGERACPDAATVRVAAPGDTSVVTLAQAFAPCGGRIRVRPFRATASDGAGG
ncbi:hypothetical protein KOAAANKH_03758 [Brevundimonas sp. NIBR10]|uniref:DUF4232 domain-containing protein n=1 Tax=Brevundimonas sp. NIBR10 TaxID=3015997 RepID=UPI0022F1768B|nr:DUF4232 domain-containing protein [Brevundimonas sp. NIBR10]WGM48850.1 hypothetical protein KOAAANKH_03758 [Brevundimonas sp. NIBR10]